MFDILSGQKFSNVSDHRSSVIDFNNEIITGNTLYKGNIVNVVTESSQTVLYISETWLSF